MAKRTRFKLSRSLNDEQKLVVPANSHTRILTHSHRQDLVSPAALTDQRLSNRASQPVRQELVAHYAVELGNKATQAILQRSSAERQEAARQARRAQVAQAEDPVVVASMDFGPHVHQPHWGKAKPVEQVNPFASRAYRQPPPTARQGAPADVQAQDAGAGGVFFHVTSFTPAVAGGLTIKETAGGLRLSSQTYTASGTVKAVGPKSRVGKWDVGFLQTVYKSSRNFYYNSAARTKSMDLCTPLPVRDGDRLKQPWYGPETVFPFTAALSDTQTSVMSDTPATFNGWNDPVSGEADTLDHTDGEDVFRSWLAVRNRSDFHKKYLRFADWQVDYATAVDTTQALGTRVTAGGAAGAKVIGTGNGMGGKQPQLFDPVANDVAKTVNVKW